LDELLKNPTRRSILEVLCTRKVVTPKDIAGELGMGVPAVYYHLDLMRGLVTKTSRGEYAATEKGLAAYREMLREEVASSPAVKQLTPHLGSMAWLSSLKILLPLGIAMAALEFSVCYLYGYRPFFFGYATYTTPGSIPLYLIYAGNLLLLFAIIEVSSYAVTRRVGGEPFLAAGLMISRLPLLVILLPAITGMSFWLTSAVCFAVGPLLAIAILALAISLSKGIRIELAVIMAFALLYFDLFIYPVL